MNRAAFTCLLGMFVASPTLAFAQKATPDAEAQQSAYRSSIAQETVRKQTDKVQEEIAQLVAELKLNGMDGADLALLTNASTHLQNLSQDDMQKVVIALQGASLTTEDQGRQQSLVTAYEGQKAVTLKLKSVADDIAAQEAKKEIPLRLENLIVRQSANIRLTSTFSSINANQFNPQQKTTHEVVTAEQSAIGGEIDIFSKALSATPAASDSPAAPDDSAEDTAAAVLKEMNGGNLKLLADAATQMTTAGPFPDAVTKQGDVRIALSSLLRISLSNLDPVSRLEEVKAQLDQITNDQRDLGATMLASTLDGSTLAERQARIEDRSSVTQALLKAVSAAAADQLGEAEQDMETNSDVLITAKNPTDSAPVQQRVVDALLKTSALIDLQIAAAQKADSESQSDRIADLSQLQGEIEQAQVDPKKSAAAGDMQKMQQEAATIAPDAANKLADAGDQEQKAQPDAAAAQADLAQAKADVQKQVDALKANAAAFQALQQASVQLATAQKDTADAQQSMQQQPAAGDLTQAAKDLAQAQQAIDQAKQDAGTPEAATPPDARKAMQQASDALKNATGQAARAQAAGAKAQAQQARAAMQQAQAGLDQAMAQLQQKGEGKPGQGQPKQPGHVASSTAANPEAPESSNRPLNGMGKGGVAEVMGGLKAKDRDALSQFQTEKAPPEYAPLVQQYLKNLAEPGESH